MPSLQVRELPDNIYHLLQERARAEHRSLAQEAVILLAKGLQTSVTNKQRRRLLLSKITTNKTASEAVKAIDPLVWIHEGRDR